MQLTRHHDKRHDNAVLLILLIVIVEGRLQYSHLYSYNYACTKHAY